MASKAWLDRRSQPAGDPKEVGAYADELVKLAPDVLVGASNSVTTAVQRRTRTIPIVFAGAGDVLESGLVKSVARPGSPPHVYPQG
jgi:putative tryptophan/tyrosine transport system substrate-binding protein